MLSAVFVIFAAFSVVQTSTEVPALSVEYLRIFNTPITLAAVDIAYISLIMAGYFAFTAYAVI